MIIEQVKNSNGETIKVKYIDGELFVVHTDVSNKYRPISKVLMDIIDKDELIAIGCMAFRVGLRANAKKGEVYKFPKYKFGEYESVDTLIKHLRIKKNK